MKKEWTNFLRKGGLSPVHVVELSHLLLMSIEMQDTGKYDHRSVSYVTYRL